MKKTTKTTKTTKQTKQTSQPSIIETADAVKIGNQTLKKNKAGGLFVPIIEQNIVNNIDELETLAFGINNNLPVLLIGETGTGKTSLLRHLARITNSNFRRLNLNGGTTNDELKGHYILDAQGNATKMKWIDGVLTDAMRNGYWLVLDEINACLPEITFTLHSLLDDDAFIVLDEKEGEVVKPHPNFRVFATMNPSFDYAGTKDLNKALLSRFPIVLQTKYQSAEIELEIIKQHNPSIEDADAVAMVKIADSIRQAKQAGTIGFVCSTRELINMAILMKKMKLQKAFELAVLNKCDFATDKQTIEDIAQLYIGKINNTALTISFAEYEKELQNKEQEMEQYKKQAEDARTQAKNHYQAYTQAEMEKRDLQVQIKLHEELLEKVKEANAELAEELKKEKASKKITK